ncbi:MAG: hypothetical protein AAFZ49_01225 [Cyanobacteria bacterium J06659_2]
MPKLTRNGGVANVFMNPALMQLQRPVPPASHPCIGKRSLCSSQRSLVHQGRFVE